VAQHYAQRNGKAFMDDNFDRKESEKNIKD
jgi:hypothetical protein